MGVAVSVLVAGSPADRADLIRGLASVTGIRTERAGSAVWLLADDEIALGAAAETLAVWWRDQGPGAVLHIDGETVASKLAYLKVNDVDYIRHLLQVSAGPIVKEDTDPADLGNQPKPAESRRRSGTFIARLVGTAEENGILTVGVAEQPDGTGRTLLLQGVNPASSSADLLHPDEGYCVIIDAGPTVYGGLTAIGIHDGVLKLRLVPSAARTLQLPTEVTITLDVDHTAVSALRTGIRRVIAYGTGAEEPPAMDLA